MERERDLGAVAATARRRVRRACVEDVEQLGGARRGPRPPPERREEAVERCRGRLCRSRDPTRASSPAARGAHRGPLARRLRSAEQFAVERDSLGIVDVGQPTERFQRPSLRASASAAGAVVGRRRGAVASSSAAVNILEAMVVAIQEVAEGGVVRLRAQVGDERRPARTANGRLEVVEHDLAALAVEVDGAAGRQEREVVADLLDDGASAACRGSRCSRSSKRNSRRCWPIRSMTVRWLLPAARRRPRPSCWVNTVADAVGRRRRTQSTSGTSTPSPRTSTENTQRSRPARRSLSAGPLVWRVVAGERDALQAGLRELARHVARVLLGDAEAERAHRAGIEHDPLDGLQKLRDAQVVVGQEVAEFLEDVAAATPGDWLRSVPSATPKYWNGTRKPWSIASQSRSSTAIRSSNHSVTSWPSRRSGVAVRPSSSVGLRWLSSRSYVAAAAWWNSSTTRTSKAFGSDLLESRLVKRLDHREDVPPFGDPAAAVDISERPIPQDCPVGG